MRSGYGSPEGVITGPVGATYVQRNGTSGKVFWVKETGTGNTGWVSIDGVQTGKTDLTGYGMEKVLRVNFVAGASDQKADIYFNGGGSNFFATFDITLTGWYAGANSAGTVRATYSVAGTSTGTAYANKMDYTVLQGTLPDHFVLSPASWDAANSRWKITISHRTTTTNAVSALVKWQTNQITESNAIRDSIGVSSVYTTDTTVPSAPTTVWIPATGRTAEKVFDVTFGSTANEKADIYFTGSPNGLFEVTVTGQFSSQNAFGAIRSVYTLSGTSTGTTYINTQTPQVSEGSLPNEVALMPATWDAANSRWRITLAHRTTNANPFLVRVAWQETTATASAATESSIGVSSVYTTNTAPGLALSPSHRTHTRATGEILATDPYFGTPGTKAAFVNALDAAEALGRSRVVRIPGGTEIDVVDTLSMSGRSCQIIGSGADNPNQASIIKATAQNGPVVNFEGYVSASNFYGKVRPLARLMIRGSGVADATKANVGIRLKAMSGAHFHDISVRSTGGACLYMAESPGNATYFCDFDRLVFETPVSAGVNDVPWFYMNEGNGNRFNALGFRNISASNDVGASGAVVVEGNASFTPYYNNFNAWWFEFLHVPTGGTLFTHKGNYSVFQDFEYHDLTTTASFPTGGSYFRLDKPTVDDTGANEIRGHIPANGVDLRQSGNRVVGTKHHPGKNVMLASGTGYSYCHLGAGSNKLMTSNAYIDNSGNATNVLVDEIDGSEIRGGKLIRSNHALQNTFLGNQSTPTVPLGGGVLYVEAGQLKYMGPSGQVTVIGAA